MKPDDSKFNTAPVGRLEIIVHPSCEKLGQRINKYIVGWRKERQHAHEAEILYKNYTKDNYIIQSTCPRFGTGEA